MTDNEDDIVTDDDGRVLKSGPVDCTGITVTEIEGTPEEEPQPYVDLIDQTTGAVQRITVDDGAVVVETLPDPEEEGDTP